MDSQFEQQGSQSTPQPMLSGAPTVGSLFTGAWELFKKKRQQIFKIAFYAFLLQVAIGIIALLLGAGTFGGVFFTSSTGNTDATNSILGAAFILTLVLAIAYALLYAWIQSAFILLFHRTETEPDMSALMTEAKPFIVPVWWTSILVALIVMVGFVLLIIPGIIFAVWYSFTMMIVVLGGLRGMDALSKSKELVKGRWMDVFLRFLALIVVVGIASGIASGIFSLFGDYLGTILSSLLSAFVFAPFTIAFQYLMYKWLTSTSSNS